MVSELLKPVRGVLGSRGVGVLPLVTGISVASVIVVAMVSQMGLDIFKRSSYAYTEWETNLGNQKALGLGGYLVAHNLILCREDGWRDLDSEVKCRWGGGYHSPRIEQSKYNISDVDYEDGSLVLSILNSEPDKRSYTTKLKVNLVDWSKQSSFRSMVGEIPVWNALADDDRFMVVMTASTDFFVSDQQKKTVSKSGALRRPIGTPNVQILSNTGKESCIFECEAGNVHSKNPECRGPLGVPESGGNAMIGVRISNLGPGAIYKLKYERTTTYDQTTYPGRTPDVVLVDVMGQQEVFMPGEKLDSEIERKCYNPIRTFQTQTTSQVATGTQATTTTSTSVTVASSFRPLSSEKFDISVSRFDPNQALDPNFNKTYNPYDAGTYKPNTSLSVIEPRRIGTELPEIEVSSPQESITQTTTTVVVRPRERVEAISTDGDGDN
ncbi:hypothetical protein [Bdellovibrio bacteriovorus]|uniref:hypothetical protein n=1 Tax=Bdellovibrio TaxID=958 RepID=UPI0035A9620C